MEQPKTTFECKSCGAPAGPEVEGGPPVPTCECNAGFFASLSAVVTGEGGAVA